MGLRIVLVSTQKGWRGGEQQAYLLAEGLRQCGHDVQIMARRNAPFADRMESEFGFPTKRLSGKGWGLPAVLSNRRFLKNYGPDGDSPQ